ncbi:MAG TPA: TetR family transcriptional regulator [Candidatus Limnocylindrales bacterium]|nr:TetR family transcriptional regulator [Candidatus Limnocylindrales bacterium]
MAGLREAKKASTSQAIVDSAMELVRGRRFADVSVDEIASAARIGRRTFFRYFPTKEDVFLDRRRIDREFITTALQARAPAEDDVTVVMHVLEEVQRRAFAAFRPEHQAELHRLTHFEPQLAARSWLLMEEVRELIVSGLVGPDPEPSELLRARVLASACIMVVDAGITTWIEGGRRDDLASVLAEGAAHLRRGFAREATTSDGRPSRMIP